MLNYLKIDLIESINILDKLAKKGADSLPNELCNFLKSELNFNDIFISEEKSENNFEIIGKSFGEGKYGQIEQLGIKQYQDLIDNLKYESDLISECALLQDIENKNLQCFVITAGRDCKYLIGMIHKGLQSTGDSEKIKESIKFIQANLFLWKNWSTENQQKSLNNLGELFQKSFDGIIKEIKTNNGLLTLIKEERLSSEVENYIGEIKKQNLKVLNCINDLSKLTKLDLQEIEDSEIKIDLSNVLENIVNNVNLDKVELQKDNQVTDPIFINEELLKSTIEEALTLLSGIRGISEIKLKTQLKEDDRLRISFAIKSLGINEEQISKLSEPFVLNDLLNSEGGLKLTLISKYIDLLNGSLKLIDDNEQFKINISLPAKVEMSDEHNIDKSFTIENSKDKILVVESDSASSSLLRNHLNKWNYSTEIVNSGSHAIRKLNENKYVAVILNIEQEEENSLLILQQIKNNKATRNTPVIVFSVEAKSEKIYLMGSVDYLVKPINYNNLVEILTSYKLRRNSTVLCVDDDKPTLNLLKQAVQTAGFNVLAFHRPELVIDEIQDKEIELAIIDLEMPIVNGFDLIKQIKSLEKFTKLPIIIYTGKEDYQNDLSNIDGLFVDLLNKRSTSFTDLENTISAMIQSYEEPRKDELDMDTVKGPKILMAEDYKHSQIIVTRLLKKSGFENIIVVENGEEALNICENDTMDLILMDMQMPVMNGFEATGKIRELPGYADTPIISLTAFAMKGDREKCLEAGATDYIPKPIDSKEFIEKVKYYTQVTVTD